MLMYILYLYLCSASPTSVSAVGKQTEPKSNSDLSFDLSNVLIILPVPVVSTKEYIELHSSIDLCLWICPSAA